MGKPIEIDPVQCPACGARWIIAHQNQLGEETTWPPPHGMKLWCEDACGAWFEVVPDGLKRIEAPKPKQ